MRKTIKLGIIVAAIIIISVIVTATILMQPQKEPLLTKNLETNVDLFDDVYFGISTDKESYDTGEEVTMTAVLSNTGSNDTTIYCGGLRNFTTGEKETKFIFYVYNENYRKIWEEPSYSTDDISPEEHMRRSNNYNITINASSSHECSHVWNQTYGAYSPPDEYGTPVPPGKYIIVAELWVSWWHYYGDVYPSRHFGNQKTITIL